MPTLKNFTTGRLQDLRIISLSKGEPSFEEIKALLYVADEVELAAFEDNSFDFSSCIFRKVTLARCTFSIDTMLTLPATVNSLEMFHCQITDVYRTSGVNTNTPWVESLSIVDSEVPFTSFLNLSTCRTLQCQILKRLLLKADF